MHFRSYKFPLLQELLNRSDYSPEAVLYKEWFEFLILSAQASVEVALDKIRAGIAEIHEMYPDLKFEEFFRAVYGIGEGVNHHRWLTASKDVPERNLLCTIQPEKLYSLEQNLLTTTSTLALDNLLRGQSLLPV